MDKKTGVDEVKVGDKLFLNEPSFFGGRYISTPVEVVKIIGKSVYVKEPDDIITYEFINSGNFPFKESIFEFPPVLLDNKRCPHVKFPYGYF